MPGSALIMKPGPTASRQNPNTRFFGGIHARSIGPYPNQARITQERTVYPFLPECGLLNRAFSGVLQGKNAVEEIPQCQKKKGPH